MVVLNDGLIGNTGNDIFGKLDPTTWSGGVLMTIEKDNKKGLSINFQAVPRFPKKPYHNP